MYNSIKDLKIISLQLIIINVASQLIVATLIILSSVESNTFSDIIREFKSIEIVLSIQLIVHLILMLIHFISDVKCKKLK